MSTSTWTPTTKLPEGSNTLIEASAGTGKTYQMEGLVVRLVAEEGLAIDEILVITFTRAAAAELRGRIRARLVKCREALLTGAVPEDDEVLKHLLELDRQSCQRRIEDAIAAYDRAMISTIHSFTQDCLTRFALEANVELDARSDLDISALQGRLMADALGTIGHAVTTEQASIFSAMGLPSCEEGVFLRGVLGDLDAEVRPGPVEGIAVPESARAWRQLVINVGARYRADLDAFFREVRAACSDFLEWAKGDGAASYGVMPSDPKTKGLWKGLPGVNANFEALWALPLLKLIEDTQSDPSRAAEMLVAIALCRKTELSANGRKKVPELAEPLQEVLDHLGTLSSALELPSLPSLTSHLAAYLRTAWPVLTAERAGRSFDTMLVELQKSLEREATTSKGGPLTRALRATYKAALVDEFQDTDAAQWESLKHLFVNSPEHRFIAVGDPKQSIYRFRGANLNVYFGARWAIGDRLFRLEKNYRSDPALVDAVNRLWMQETDPPPFLTGAIDYPKVKPGKAEPDSGPEHPMEIRWITAQGEKPMNKATAQRQSALHACARAQELLSTAGISPRDIAVLAKDNYQLAEIARVFEEHGIPTIRRLKGTVFESKAAGWLACFLEALGEPEREGPTISLALTPFVGLSLEQLGKAVKSSEQTPEGELWARLRARVIKASDQLSKDGLAPTFHKWEHDFHVYAKVIGLGGEREATDLSQLLSWADATARSRYLDATALAAALRQRISQPPSDEDDEPGLSRPTESDANAVQLVTIHGSKGLQYPYVLLPFAWSVKGLKVASGEPLRYTDEQGQAVIDLHQKGTPEREAAEKLATKEIAEEQRRLLYVALTRAKHQVVCWLTAREKSENGPLAALLDLKSPQDASRAPEEPPLLRDAEHLTWFVEPKEPELQTFDPDSPELPELRAWTREYALNGGWLLTSFSGLRPKKALDHAAETGTPETARGADEDPDADATPQDALAPSPTRLPEPPVEALLVPAAGAGFFGGTHTGSWLHGVLESLDFQDPTRALDGSPLAELIAAEGLRYGVTHQDQLKLAEDLVPGWMETPFGRLPGGAPETELTLNSFDHAHRADELEFYLRLGAGYAGGKARVEEAKVREALAYAVDDPGFRAQDWLKGFLERKTTKGDPASIIGRLQGFMQGFIDVVLQIGDPPDARFLICDYKTNDLSGTAELKAHTAAWGAANAEEPPPRLRRWHYDQHNLETGMDHHHYHLQALIYTVAVHRMLAQRLDDYDYDRHIAGHAYFFLRGMEGSDTWRDDEGRPLGIWIDRWPRNTIHALSSALEGDR